MIARTVDILLTKRLADAADQVAAAVLVDRPSTIVIAGSGEFLARRLAGRIVAPGGSIRSLADAWGAEASAAACAHALIRLLAAGGDDMMVSPGPILVVKLGGSLLDWPEWPARLLAFLATRPGRRAVLVVGGGRFADALRELDRLHALGEERSHVLALHALDLTAEVAAALLPGAAVVRAVEKSRKPGRPAGPRPSPLGAGSSVRTDPSNPCRGPGPPRPTASRPGSLLASVRQNSSSSRAALGPLGSPPGTMPPPSAWSTRSSPGPWSRAWRSSWSTSGRLQRGRRAGRSHEPEDSQRSIQRLVLKPPGRAGSAMVSRYQSTIETWSERVGKTTPR